MPQYFFKETKKEKIKKLIPIVFAILFIIIAIILFIPKSNKSSAEINKTSELQKIQKQVIKQKSKIIKNEYIVKPGEVFSLLYEKLKLSQAYLQQIYQNAKDIYNLENIKAGNKIEVIFKDKKFQEFIYNIDNEKYLTVKNTKQGLKAILEKYDYKTEIIKKQGTIKTSFYKAAKNQNIPDKIIMEMANIFAWDIDFGFDSEKGDTFKIVYEKRTLDGKEVKPGKILIAKFINRGEDHYGLYYKDDSGKFDYYDLKGNNLKRTFLRSPLQFKYISSGFTYKRWHPKFGGYTPHLAIDYAAPSGTPVVSPAKGRVIFVGWKSCIGRTITIRHNSKYTTRYSHLISYADNIYSGAKVKQGQIIGYVGSTGSCSTGPHLEYAMKVYGQAVNPLHQEFERLKSISQENKADFKIKKQALLEMLDEE